MSDQPPHVKFSRREKEVLRLVAEGHKNEEIATSLEIGGETVKTHVQNLIQKSGARNRTHVVSIAFRQGFLK